MVSAFGFYFQVHTNHPEADRRIKCLEEQHIKGANNKAQGDKARINDEIKAREVRLIGKDGEQVGVVSLAEATRTAEEASLDLVEISPNAEPPVCKVMDYGKFLFEKK